MPASMPLRNKPKWTDRLTTPAGTMRKADEGLSLNRPLGRKATSVRKVSVLEQQIYINIFMQSPDGEESKGVFVLQRKAILAKIRTNPHDEITSTAPHVKSHHQHAANTVDDGQQTSAEMHQTTSDTVNKDNINNITALNHDSIQTSVLI
ncbi:hypothetical protein PI124_g135 [Phytophthora idaei]|nr:hypothetical protein PI125_g17982 [Phytophthora idaei]KAG3137925.1 hypothetical protein PI126_g17155 [Phytophthora idaei]KAG3255240.1 hypothetical protein PI124_g135 [Phytophthora idaei]